MRNPTVLAEALLASPLGCSFLNQAELHGLTAEEIADPTTVFFLAGRAWEMISPWWAEQAREISALLRQAPRWTKLAHAIMDDPRNAWWFDDLDRSAQLLIRQAQPTMPTAPPTALTDDKRAEWERYSQQPVWPTCTSTALDGLSSYLVSASEMVEDLGPLSFPVQRSLVTIAPEARVFEVHGPEDWSRLCRRYAADEPGGLHGGSLVPDFSLVAADWDGVHLSFGGLLTTTHVPLDGPGGRTMLDSWEAEQTVWLAPSFVAETRLADLEREVEVPTRFR